MFSSNRCEMHAGPSADGTFHVEPADGAACFPVDDGKHDGSVSFVSDTCTPEMSLLRDADGTTGTCKVATCPEAMTLESACLGTELRLHPVPITADECMKTCCGSLESCAAIEYASQCVLYSTAVAATIIENEESEPDKVCGVKQTDGTYATTSTDCKTADAELPSGPGLKGGGEGRWGCKEQAEGDPACMLHTQEVGSPEGCEALCTDTMGCGAFEYSALHCGMHTDQTETYSAITLPLSETWGYTGQCYAKA